MRIIRSKKKKKKLDIRYRIFNFSKSKCTQSFLKQLQSSIRDPRSHKFFSSYILNSCSDQTSNVVIIDYNCIPDENVAYINTSIMCNAIQVSETSGLIKSPNFPIPQTNVDCSISIKTDSNKLIRLYSMSTELQSLLPGQDECEDSYLALDNVKFCGARKPELITEKCGTNFKLDFHVGNKPFKGFKIYYERKY